jgi:hypothetical protein
MSGAENKSPPSTPTRNISPRSPRKFEIKEITPMAFVEMMKDNEKLLKSTKQLDSKYHSIQSIHLVIENVQNSA